MALNSLQFIIAFFLFFLFYLCLEYIGRKSKWIRIKRIQIVSLLLFSYFFIEQFYPLFCLCVACVSLLVYLAGLLIEKEKNMSFKRWWLGLSIIILIGILGYFKYTNFLMEALAGILHRQYEVLNIILPIGISFYIFSALSYLIDLYRGKIKAEKNIIDFFLYISFFPKLIAGPIVRAKDFLPQIKKYQGISQQGFLDGIQIFVFGLFKKMVLADHLAVFVDDVFYAPSAFNTATVILAIISYSLQIYFDFSGYSDLAIGIAKMLGFEFLPNFNFPYLAEGMSDFWKRWHISLSSWFMDYLYIPLGGSRKGNLRCYLNLILVMVVSGLWHGAGFTFIIWGVLHGLASSVERFMRNCNISLAKIPSIILTYITVSLFWVFFRADTVANALEVYRAAFTIHGGISQAYSWSFFAVIVYAIVIFVIYHPFKKKEEGFVAGNYLLLDLKKFVPRTFFFILCGLTVLMGYYGNTAFIYGAF